MSTKRKKKEKFAGLIWTSIIIIISCIVYGLMIYDLKDRGTFGDMFGALTALFSGLAFAGIIYTILLQRQELRLQRRELRLSRQEFSTQNSTLKKQRFDNTFFNLLNHHLSVVSAIFFHISRRVEGQGAFSEAYQGIISHTSNTFYQFKQENGIDKKKDISDLEITMLERLLDKMTRRIFKEMPNDYPLYAQSLYQLLKFLDSSNLLDSEEERVFYSEIIKDQMTDQEKVMIMYYCLLAEEEAKRVGDYVYKYGVVDQVNPELFISRRDIDVFKKWGRKNI